MRKLFPLVVFLLFISNVYAQQIIQGTISDTSGQPISFISVSIKGMPVGTISNDQGQFLLQVRSFPDTLTFTHLSYMPQQLVVTNSTPIKVILQSQVIQLNEVSVGNPALTLIKLAADKAYKTAITPYLAKAFSRQIMTEADKPAFFAENFLDVQWQNWGITKYKITNARYLKRPDAVSYNNLTLLTYICSEFLKNTMLVTPINHQPDSLYKFKIKETFTNNGQQISVISCALRDPDAKGFAFTGDIYINSDTYDVVKTEGTIHGLKMTLSGPYGAKLKELKIMSQFKLDDKGNNVLDYSSFVLTYDMKVLGLVAKTLNYSSTLFILNYDPTINPASLTNIDPNTKVNDEEMIKKIPYDPVFWKNNPVIRRTQADDDAITFLEGLKKQEGNY